jgi:predicted PurR-regulated permease PerM
MTSEDPLEKIRREAAHAEAAAAEAAMAQDAAEGASTVAEAAAGLAESSAHSAEESADEAATSAQAAASVATRMRDDVAGSAGRLPSERTGATAMDATAAARGADDDGEGRSAEEKSEEFLLDALPDESSDTPYGTPGPPLKRHSPFYFGFFAGAGALLAWWLGGLILSIASVLVLVVVALFIAVGLNPVVEALMRRGVRRMWAVTAVTVGVLAAVTLFVVAIAPVITEQVGTIVDRAPQWFEQLKNNGQVQRLDDKYDLISRIQQTTEDAGWAQRVFGGVLGFGLAVVSALLNAFIILVLTLYFLASLPNIKRATYRLAPASRRERVTFLGDQILGNVGGYVFGAFLVALCAGVSTLVFLFAIGLGEYAVALAAVVMILDIIPMIGATLGAVVVVAIGLATDVRTGIICLVFYVLYQQLENYFIYPRVMSRSVDIPGSLIVIAALVGAGLLGVVGALLAIPTAAAIQLLLKEVFLRRQDVR